MQTGAVYSEDHLTIDRQQSEAEIPLVARAQEGDLESFRQLYDENVGRVYALCLRLVANPGRAEELTQDTFVRAWQTLHTFRGESQFSSWLHRVAVNTVLMDMRSRRRREDRVVTVEDPEESAMTYTIPSPGNAVDLEQAIAALPPQARTVFVLYDIEGYTHEEIAAQLGLAVGTTKAQLHRARMLLREALQR